MTCDSSAGICFRLIRSNSERLKSAEYLCIPVERQRLNYSFPPADIQGGIWQLSAVSEAPKCRFCKIPQANLNKGDRCTILIAFALLREWESRQTRDGWSEGLMSPAHWGKELWAETVCTNSLIGQTLQANCDPDGTVLWRLRPHCCHIRYTGAQWHESEHFVNPKQYTCMATLRHEE